MIKHPCRSPSIDMITFVFHLKVAVHYIYLHKDKFHALCMNLQFEAWQSKCFVHISPMPNGRQPNNFLWAIETNYSRHLHAHCSCILHLHIYQQFLDIDANNSNVFHLHRICKTTWAKCLPNTYWQSTVTCLHDYIKWPSDEICA